eukprot:1484892-Pyramimonas_sp.AAC.1
MPSHEQNANKVTDRYASAQGELPLPLIPRSAQGRISTTVHRNIFRLLCASVGPRPCQRPTKGGLAASGC